MQPIDIAGRKVGPGHPCFIIAEAGVNHNGDLTLAHRLVDVAADAGADAVKFQTFVADRIATTEAPKAEYQFHVTRSDETQVQMLRRLELSPAMHRELAAHCRGRGILFLSTPFDEQSADLLEELKVPAFKVPSGEITNWPLLDHIARKGKPLILSTGMSYLGEVDEALRVIRKAGCKELILLHCLSNYPADPAEVNLRAMDTMATVFEVPVGYSDHTLGLEVALAAVARGACMLEKHFTLDRSLPGPDHQASLGPDDLVALVRGIRRVETALGHGRKIPAESEVAIARVVRKSLVARQDIAPGTVLTEDLIVIKRPGTGLPPGMRAQVIGRTSRARIPAGTVLTMDMLT